ncbi:cysteine synthase-like [Ylistrum balloti]|uniref:cysteine synthase-like n=1 Tax=Ylistrum balloti TaxID=509963 RepID=UPI0029058771|nr:cysteine synthase-like [Ylistrum balloti]
MSPIISSSIDLVGKTPLLDLGPLNNKGCAHVYAKLESHNPGGSVKDRICRSMILAAEAKGNLQPDSIIIEPTSGNTGIGLAWLAAARGYECILTMPESMSPERIQLLQAFGATVELTPHEGGMGSAIIRAEELLAHYGERAFMPQQFENPANPEAHRLTTGPEILQASQELGLEITAFVAGVGTGGTLTGVGETLRQQQENVTIVAVEPTKSPVLSGGKPGNHNIQGIGAGFIPKILNLDLIDRIELVDDQEAIDMQRRLAREVGIFAGISAGANVVAALEVATDLPADTAVITIICDTGERYLSLDLF